MLIPVVTDELFLSVLDCGPNCVHLSAVAYDLSVLWEYPNRTTNFGYCLKQQFLYSGTRERCRNRYDDR